MLDVKKGFPSEGDIVFCTVTNVQYNSVFAKLDEFENKSGMIHISEISPGRIRNIRDYVKEGKVIICKVLRIHKDRGHIDLSLRRVTESQRRDKVETRKQQIISENILKSYALLDKKKLKDVYQAIADKILEHYESIYLAFEDIVENGVSLTSMGFDKTEAKKLEDIIKDRIKPKQVVIMAALEIESYDENGVDVIRDIMSELMKVNDKQIDIHFLGAGKFKITINAPEYKEAEDMYSAFEKILKKNSKGDITSYTFARA